MVSGAIVFRVHNTECVAEGLLEHHSLRQVWYLLSGRKSAGIDSSSQIPTGSLIGIYVMLWDRSSEHFCCEAVTGKLLALQHPPKSVCIYLSPNHVSVNLSHFDCSCLTTPHVAHAPNITKFVFKNIKASFSMKHNSQ